MNFKFNNILHIYNIYMSYLYIMYSCMYFGFVPKINFAFVLIPVVSPFLAALSPGRQFTPRSPSPNRSLQSFSTYNSLVNNCAPHATMPAFAVPTSRLPPTGPGNSARSSSLRPGWAGLRNRKASTSKATSLGFILKVLVVLLS